MSKYYIHSSPDKDVSNAIKLIRKSADKHDLIETSEPKDADLIISVGGDGTFLRASKLAIGTPMFGVNKGTLGYLTEVEEHGIELAILRCITGDYTIQKRMMLEEINIPYPDNMYALNDIVISKGLSSVVGLNVYIDNILTAKYYADGIIVSTPTGSTGYSLSCGGPIIAPSSEMIIITPIAPHTIYNRSIVVPSESNVEIELTEIKGGNTAFLSIDGEQIKIKEKEKIAVVKSKKSTNLISFEESSFFDNIRMKMG